MAGWIVGDYERVLPPFFRGSGKLNLVDGLGTSTGIILSDIVASAAIEDGFEDGEEDPNMVRIEKKPIMKHDVACMTLLNTGAADVRMIGRAQPITTSAGVVDLLRRRFL